MKSDREKAAVTRATTPDVDGKLIEAEVVDAASLPQEWLIPKPVQVPVASALTGRGAVKVARLHADIAEEEARASELELRMQRAQAEAAKVRAETFALIRELVVRIKRLRREAEELTTQIEIELATRDDKVRTAKALSALERLRAETLYKIGIYEAIVQRNDAKTRAAASSREFRASRKTVAAATQLDDDDQRGLVAWAELIAAEAAEENLQNPTIRPYGEFAAFYYVCARLRGESHGDAIVSTAHLLVSRKLVNPIGEDDSQREFYRERLNQVRPLWRTHRQALRTGEQQQAIADAAKERDLLLREMAELKLKTVERELEIAKLHHGAADAGGDTVYDREA